MARGNKIDTHFRWLFAQSDPKNISTGVKLFFLLAGIYLETGITLLFPQMVDAVSKPDNFLSFSGFLRLMQSAHLPGMKALLLPSISESPARDPTCDKHNILNAFPGHCSFYTLPCWKYHKHIPSICIHIPSKTFLPAKTIRFRTYCSHTWTRQHGSAP